VRPLRLRLTWVLTLIAFFASSADAHVTRVEILSRADLQDGRAFGLAGAYERIIGRVYFAINPENIHNRPIVDLDKAPRNAQGEVEFSADLYLFKPKDMAKGNNAVLFEVSNRGGKGILRLVNGGNTSDPNNEFGDGFLLREGSPLPLLMIQEEKKFAAWCVPISRHPKKETRCLWDISCWAPLEEKVIRSTILPVRKMSSPCATRRMARGR